MTSIWTGKEEKEEVLALFVTSHQDSGLGRGRCGVVSETESFYNR